ncbi:MAG: PhnD/SsuA/transferrin family substrate-binding protein [Dehalococcoidia bacterium]|nr:PhnD/SsuA/transferrin family substrate-binding protein [Dehalococcoidia bacterium]
MVRLGGSATESHFKVFQGLEVIFRRRGIDMDWVLYSDYDAMVDAFVKGDIDLAWNGPLGYVKIKRLLDKPCQVIAMRDVDIDFVTQFITHADSDVLTVEDLTGKRFAFGRRGSERAGLVPYHVLKQAGLDPRKDLADISFYEERQSPTASDELDVMERVGSGEFDAGAVSQKTLEHMAKGAGLNVSRVRVFWSSPSYSHCCFTAQQDMEPRLASQIEAAFLSITGSDDVERAVLEGEACDNFVPGVEGGWEIIEDAAVAEGLV